MIIGILAVIAIGTLSNAFEKAYKIYAKQDLKNFISYEEANYQTDYKFINFTETIQNNGDSSEHTYGFTLSRGVIISAEGNPDDPYNSDTPFTVTSTHNKIPIKYAYNFVTGEWTETEK